MKWLSVLVPALLLFVLYRRAISNFWLLVRTDWHTYRHNHQALFPLLREGVRRHQRQSGEHHPSTVYAKVHLGELLFTHGHRDEGLAMVNAAADSMNRYAGERDDTFAVTWMNVAIALWKTEQKDAAVSTLLSVLELRRKLSGPDHPRVAEIENNLGAFLDETGRPAEAVPVYEDALRIRLRKFGKDSREVALVRNNFCGALTSLERWSRAEEEILEAIRIMKPLGPDYLLGEAYGSYAILLAKQEKLAQAERLRSDSLAALQQALGEKHVEIAKAWEEYAELLDRLQRTAEAELMRAKAKAMREELSAC